MKRLVVLCLGLALALALPVKAQVSVPAASPLTDVIWIQRASDEQFDENYPLDARQHGIAGHVVLDCVVGPDEHRHDGIGVSCDLQSETPVGMGFGPAALSMTRYYRVAPNTIQTNEPTAGRHVRIDLGFNPPPGRSCGTALRRCL